MAIAQIKNLQRRLANMESEATAALDRACGNSLWASIGPDAIDGLEDPAARAQANYYYGQLMTCLLYTSPSPRDLSTSRMPSSA